MNFKAIRGTNDHMPEDMATWNFVESVARNTASMFGYKEISTPIFEQTVQLNEQGIANYFKYDYPDYSLIVKLKKISLVKLNCN